MKKSFLIMLVLLIIVLGVFWLRTQSGPSNVFSQDTMLTSDLVVEAGEKVVLKNGAKLTINGNLVVKGEISCDKGPLQIIVNGEATIENSLDCELGEMLEDSSDLGIALAVRGNLTMGENALIETNGHIVFVDSEAAIPVTKVDFEKLYDEAGEDSGEGSRMGPFITKPATTSDAIEEEEQELIDELGDTKEEEITINYKLFNLIKVAQAQAGQTVTVSGRVVVRQRQRDTRQVVLINFPNASTINIVNFDLTGPDGWDGNDDINRRCNARGQNGQDALRFLAKAPNITVDRFALDLGSGGNGGNAESKNDCRVARASGGDGGRSGNIKMVGSRDFRINGAFTIWPGISGNGGNAMANGQDGGPDEDGGDAIARGGHAEDNEKAIRAVGNIAGQENIQIGPITAGKGGNATARPGKGGNGSGIKMPGGNGGFAFVRGGNGGDARVALSGRGAVRTQRATDIGGDGGDADAVGGKGGQGGTGTAKDPGGNGGQGGKAIAKTGKAGIGGTRAGNPGVMQNRIGGDGGNGGDGCDEGQGGQGGNGAPIGVNGIDGRNICPPPPGAAPAGGAVIPGGGVPGGGAAPPPVAPPPAGPPPAGPVGIIIAPLNLSFTHNIGSTECPQPVGSIKISAEGESAAGWRLAGDLPFWLMAPNTSGSLPGSLPLSFSCELEKYNTQSLDTILSLQLVDDSGQPIGGAGSVSVSGQVNAE